MDEQCPYCNADIVLEDLGDHPCFLSGSCDECDGEFSYDSNSETWYDSKGNTIVPLWRRL